MNHRMIESLRRVSPRDAAKVGISHLFLLLACLWGGLPYLFLQALLAIELILVSLATIPFYPERTARKHLLDVLKLSAGLAFALIFIVVFYGLSRSGDNESLKSSLWGLRGLGVADGAWALGYLALHLLISMRDARRSSDPRKTWTRIRLIEAGTTFVALFLMIFVSIFLGLPAVSAFTWLGLDINVDAWLSTLMIVVRYVVALVMTLMTDSELDAIALNPYRDS